LNLNNATNVITEEEDEGYLTLVEKLKVVQKIKKVKGGDREDESSQSPGSDVGDKFGKKGLSKIDHLTVKQANQILDKLNRQERKKQKIFDLEPEDVQHFNSCGIERLMDTSKKTNFGQLFPKKDSLPAEAKKPPPLKYIREVRDNFESLKKELMNTTPFEKESLIDFRSSVKKFMSNFSTNKVGGGQLDQFDNKISQYICHGLRKTKERDGGTTVIATQIFPKDSQGYQ
jgi:hypothetical protein